MKKKYITPIVEIELMDDLLVQTFSKTEVDGTTEHIETENITVTTKEDTEGEGMNDAKKNNNIFFDLDW